MRKYIASGNIFPDKKEINILFPGGNLYPPKYITMNTNKETHKSLRASEDTRIKNNLTIVFDYISFASLLKKAFYKYLKSKLIFQNLIYHIRFQILPNLKPNQLIKFCLRVINWFFINYYEVLIIK